MARDGQHGPGAALGTAPLHVGVARGARRRGARHSAALRGVARLTSVRTSAMRGWMRALALQRRQTTHRCRADTQRPRDRRRRRPPSGPSVSCALASSSAWPTAAGVPQARTRSQGRCQATRSATARLSPPGRRCATPRTACAARHRHQSPADRRLRSSQCCRHRQAHPRLRQAARLAPPAARGTEVQAESWVKGGLVRGSARWAATRAASVEPSSAAGWAANVAAGWMVGSVEGWAAGWAAGGMIE